MPWRIGAAAARSQVGQDTRSQPQVVAQVIGQRVERGLVLQGWAECTLTQQPGQVVDVSWTATIILAGALPNQKCYLS